MLTNTSRQRSPLPSLSALLLLTVFWALVTHYTQWADVTTQQAPQSTTASCLSEHEAHSHYFDTGKLAASNFGPSLKSRNASHVQANLIRWLCGDKQVGGDRRLYASLSGELTGEDPNRQLPRFVWERQLNHFVRRADWNKLYLVEGTVPVGTMTYAMWPNTQDLQSEDPVIYRVPLMHRTDIFAVLPIKRGSEIRHLVLRLSCGGQPVRISDTTLAQLKRIS